jgi:hypothetical protein
MGEETERKYLVQSDAWRQEVQSKAQIRQGYLSTHEARNVRIRLEEERVFLTIKGETQGQTRAEFEYPISIADATQIMEKLCIKPLSIKARHTMQASKLTGRSTSSPVKRVHLSWPKSRRPHRSRLSRNPFGWAMKSQMTRAI